MSITGSRPSTHWDATLPEVIQPDAQGQVKTWTLHVATASPTSRAASAFFRFVETMLHKRRHRRLHGHHLLPVASTTREQMAVFALVSKEGAGYAPPPAGTPMFGDVPASQPVLPLDRGAGPARRRRRCGGGHYCPAAAVTREQMAIFALKTLEGPAYVPPACGAPMYSDVPATSPFCPYIEELTRRGVVAGCGGGNYCPPAAVSREQMSVFLTVTFGLAAVRRLAGTAP